MHGAWWYLVGDSPQGPVALERIEAMLHAEEMTSHSLVWQEGLADWICVSELGSLADRQATPAAIARLTRPPLAGAWRRFMARMLDLWLIALPTAILVAAALARFRPQLMGQPYAMYLLALASFALVLLIEAGVYGCCGNTAGKALFGITVTTLDGKHPTAAQYLRRQVGVFWYGFAMGLPLISLLAMAAQGLNLRNGQPAAYDAGRFVVQARR